MKRLTNLVMIGLVCITFAACSKKGGTSVATAPATETWGMSNGQCVSSTTGAIDSTKCTTTTTSGYHYNGNGQCCDANNNVVGNNSCTGSGGVTCSGFYWYVDYDGSLWSVQCDGKTGNGNCSGYDLIKGSDGSMVYCN